MCLSHRLIHLGMRAGSLRGHGCPTSPSPAFERRFGKGETVQGCPPDDRKNQQNRNEPQSEGGIRPLLQRGNFLIGIPACKSPPPIPLPGRRGGSKVPGKREGVGRGGEDGITMEIFPVPADTGTVGSQFWEGIRFHGMVCAGKDLTEHPLSTPWDTFP